jgi:hypothetical protein
VLVLVDVEKRFSGRDLITIDLMVRATMPGRYLDVIVKESPLDVLGNGNREKLLAVCWEMLEASEDAWRCACAHLTLPGSHVLASLGAHVES